MRTEASYLFGVAALVLALARGASAHVEGHGKKIEGKGPSGGALVAVVAAADAEKKDPESKALAEWKRSGNSIEVTVWDIGKAKKLEVSKGSEVKWILIGGALEKPVVLKDTASGSTLGRSFEQGILAKAGAVEVIVALESGKHVFVLDPNGK